MIPGKTTPLTLPGLTVTSLSKETPDSKFDLTVYLHEDKDQLNGTTVYNTALFRAERIEALVAQYQQVLEHIVASPDQSIQYYSLMTAESQAILPDPHQSLDIPNFNSVPARIRAWAMSTPAHVAVRHGSMALRYDDLLSRSEACARALRKQGLGQGDVIAIRGARSIGLITCHGGRVVGRRGRDASGSKTPGFPPNPHATKFQGHLLH
jgi:non-ribosomal peptide synthetase component F